MYETIELKIMLVHSTLNEVLSRTRTMLLRRGSGLQQIWTSTHQLLSLNSRALASVVFILHNKTTGVDRKQPCKLTWCSIPY